MRTAPDAGSAGFSASLQAEHDALGAFISLLQAEQEILVHGDAERLAELAPDKARQLDVLTRLGEQRRRFLDERRLAANGRGMEQWLAKQPEPGASALRATWQELLRRAQNAQNLNQSNGILIENRLQQNRMKIAVLQAAVAGGDKVYRPDGQVGSLRSGRMLGAI